MSNNEILQTKSLLRKEMAMHPLNAMHSNPLRILKHCRLTILIAFPSLKNHMLLISTCHSANLFLL